MIKLGKAHLSFQIIPVAKLFKIGVLDDAAAREVLDGHLFEFLTIVVISGYHSAHLNRDHSSQQNE